MERLDALVIDIDEIEMLELLQHKMAWVVKNIGANVVLHLIEEHFESRPVMQILARVQFIANIDAVAIELIENW